MWNTFKRSINVCSKVGVSRTFGIELELIVPKKNVDTYGKLVELINYDVGIPCIKHKKDELFQISNEWKIEKDSSIAVNGFEVGFEMISPILMNNNDTMEIILKLCNYLENKLGCYANLSCGYHLHLDCSDLNMKDITKLAINYAYFETVIDYFMTPNRHGNKNTFCRTLRQRNIIQDTVNSKYFENMCNDNSITVLDILNPQRKNHKINFRNVFYSRMNSLYNSEHKIPNTIENRHHHGTCNYNDISHWLQFNTLFINAVLNNSKVFIFDDNDLINDHDNDGDESNNIDNSNFTSHVTNEALYELYEALFKYIDPDNKNPELKQFYGDKIFKIINGS